MDDRPQVSQSGVVTSISREPVSTLAARVAAALVHVYKPTGYTEEWQSLIRDLWARVQELERLCQAFPSYANDSFDQWAGAAAKNSLPPSNEGGVVAATGPPSKAKP